MVHWDHSNRTNPLKHNRLPKAVQDGELISPEEVRPEPKKPSEMITLQNCWLLWFNRPWTNIKRIIEILVLVKSYVNLFWCLTVPFDTDRAG